MDHHKEPTQKTQTTEKSDHTAFRIRQAAIIHFGRQGYAGASMSEIAADVGIKKPSIYAHYESKEALFTACLQYAAETILQELHVQLSNGEDRSVTDILYNLLKRQGEQLEKDPAVFFHLRFAYFPPEELKAQVIQYSNAYIQQFGEVLKPVFIRWQEEIQASEGEMEDAREAFLCMFDGLMIELIFAGTASFYRRLEQSWRHYRSGIWR